MSLRETTLAELPGEGANERVMMVHVYSDRLAESHVELRQQTWALGIGWFTQSTICLTPAQVSALRSSLGSAPQARAMKPIAAANSFVRVVHADSA